MRNFLKLGSLLLTAALLTASAYAQDDDTPMSGDVLPPGDIPSPGMENECVMNIGYVACEQADLHRGPGAAAPTFWAAIAVSASTMAVGGAHGRNSQSQADSTALQNCRSGGAGDCKVVTDGANQCLAIATSSDKGDGYGPGATRSAAASNALSICQKEGGKSCVIVATPCAGDDVRWSAPLPLPIGLSGGKVDPVLVGTWIMKRNPGQWVWRVAANGTYEFHSEAMDNTPSNNGTLTASGGHYTLHAISLAWDDVGTYIAQDRNKVVATGKLGTGARGSAPTEPVTLQTCFH